MFPRSSWEMDRPWDVAFPPNLLKTTQPHIHIQAECLLISRGRARLPAMTLPIPDLSAVGIDHDTSGRLKEWERWVQLGDLKKIRVFAVVSVQHQVLGPAPSYRFFLFGLTFRGFFSTPTRLHFSICAPPGTLLDHHHEGRLTFLSLV